jgi:putative ABC transport system permease protein
MSLLRNLVEGLRTLFRKKRAEQEMDEELRAYLDAAVKEKMRSGITADQALRSARVEMGSMEAVKDGIRSAGWETHVESLWQDIRYGLRMLRKNAVLTAVVVLTLALGIGANTAIFSLIDAVLLRLLPVQNPQELVRLARRGPRPGPDSPSFTNALWEQIRDRQDMFSGVFAWGEERFDLAQGGAVNLINGLWVSGDYFKTLKLRPASGRLLAAADDQRGCQGVAVLSYTFWRDRFGGEERAIGGTLSIDNHPFPIVGVAPAGFHGLNVGSKFDVAIPICATALFDSSKMSRVSHRSWWWLSIGGRVKPDTSPAQMKSRLRLLSPPVFTNAVPSNWNTAGQRIFAAMILTSAPAANGISDLRQQFEQPLHVLMAVVGLVLLIACANIASLMLARSASRRKEIAVRQALGASRRRLIRQLLTECVLLSTAGALCGIVLARWAGALLVRYISTKENNVFLDLSLDARVLGFTAAIAVFTGVLFGVLPALRSTRVSMTAAMKGGAAPDGERHLRFLAGKCIVAVQVALSLVLVVASGLFLKSFQNLATLDIGFDRDNVVLVGANLKPTHIPPDLRLPTYDQIEARLRVIPGVVSASRSSNTPISGFTWNNAITPDSPNPPKGDDALAYLNFISPGYFETLRTPRVTGRNFTDRDTKNAPQVAIVNQTLARRFFPALDPVGRTFKIDTHPGQPAHPVQIVGVVKDAKYESLREDTHPTAFFPISQIPELDEHESFELRTSIAMPAITSAVQSAVAGVNKEISLDFHTLSGQVDDSLVRDRLLATLSTFFGALALLLAMIGLYGTFSYLVTQRQKEFGVRMALGARLNSIVGLVLREVAAVLAGGVAAGVCIALVSTGPLQKMLFELGARDALTIVAATGVLSAVAFIAAYLPARRAARVDPMVALREE